MTKKRIDPLLCDFELPLTGVFYPAGFALQLSTNSPDAMEAAAEAWGCWRNDFQTEPLQFRVVVEPEGELTSEPTFRKQGRLLSFVFDAHNFATADTGTLTAGFHLSRKTAANHTLLRWFYLEAMAYMLLTQRYVVSIHSGCVARKGSGILLCGKSGSGKSTLSFACARAGFTFLADDCTWMLAGAPELIAIGKPHQVRFRHDAARHFPELNGQVARALPNGKLSMEVPTSLFPGITTARQSLVGCLVFLDRQSQGLPGLEPVSASEAAASLLADMPSYGDEVNAMHEGMIHRLAGLPAWRLRYGELDEAIPLLSEL